MILNILVDRIFLLEVYSLSTHAQDQSNSTLASLPSWLRDALQDDHVYPMWVTENGILKAGVNVSAISLDAILLP